MYVPAHSNTPRSLSRNSHSIYLSLVDAMLCVFVWARRAALSETQNSQKSQKEKLNRPKARSYKSNLPGMLADH